MLSFNCIDWPTWMQRGIQDDSSVLVDLKVLVRMKTLKHSSRAPLAANVNSLILHQSQQNNRDGIYFQQLTLPTVQMLP